MMHVERAEQFDKPCQWIPPPVMLEVPMETGPRIVLVEDEGPLRKIIARNLQRRGYDVVETETGAAALTVLRWSPPRLLLLDVNLPDMTGWDVLRELPTDLRRQIPTIVLSAAAQSPKRLSEFREVTFLHKPFPLDTLLRLVADKLSGGFGMGWADLTRRE
jgi:DNA-binding response OmpR family regulator